MNSIGEVKAACARVADGLPTGFVHAASTKASEVLALLTAEFTGSTNPHYQAAVAELRGMLAALESAEAALTAAGGRARSYGDRL